MRYDQCDTTCTVDCGHCKGLGMPTKTRPGKGTTVTTDTSTELPDAPRDHQSGTLIRDYPLTLRPVVGVEFVAKFVRLDRGIDTGYGVPFIAVFDQVERGSHAPTDNGPVVDLVDHDGEVGLWLIHSTALTGLKELRPEPGERVAMIYLGKRDRKTLTVVQQAKQARGDDVRYHAYRFTCPDRPEAAPATWDTIDATPDSEPAPF